MRNIETLAAVNVDVKETQTMQMSPYTMPGKRKKNKKSVVTSRSKKLSPKVHVNNKK